MYCLTYLTWKVQSCGKTYEVSGEQIHFKNTKWPKYSGTPCMLLLPHLKLRLCILLNHFQLLKTCYYQHIYRPTAGLTYRKLSCIELILQLKKIFNWSPDANCGTLWHKVCVLEKMCSLQRQSAVNTLPWDQYCAQIAWLFSSRGGQQELRTLCFWW